MPAPQIQQMNNDKAPTAGACNRRYFATCFTQQILPFGIALLASLQRHMPAFLLQVYCDDEQTYNILSRLRIIGVRPVLKKHVQMAGYGARGKQNSPSMPEVFQYFLHTVPQDDMLIWLDSKLFALGDVHSLCSPVCHEHACIYTVEHNGHILAPMAHVRATEAGMQALHAWDSAWGDEDIFSCEATAHAASPYIASCAQPKELRGPWAMGMADRHEGSFLHFHGLEVPAHHCAVPCTGRHALTVEMLRQYYVPYLEELMRAHALIRSVSPQYHQGFMREDVNPESWLVGTEAIKPMLNEAGYVHEVALGGKDKEYILFSTQAIVDNL